MPGQAGRNAEFFARSGQYRFLLNAAELTIVRDGAHGAPGFQIRFMGCNTDAVGVGVDELPGVANYFTSPDPLQWHRQIPTYSKVLFSAPYPGVDLTYRGNGERLEYDFLLAPGADPGQIRMLINGPKKTIHADGDPLSE